MPRYITAPAADFDGAGNLTTLANAKFHPTGSLSGLTAGASYRACRLSDPSQVFEREAPPGPPPADNARFVVNGDSRTQQAVAGARGTHIPTTTAANGEATNANGWVAHTLAALGHRCVLPRGGQFAIGAETTTNMVSRLAQDVQQAVDYGASVVFFLGGVNDPAGGLATTLTNYDTIFAAYTAAGIRLVVMNELPNNGAEGNPTASLARVAWLSDPQRALDYPGIVQVDTFGVCVKPGTQMTWRDGFAYDALHPSYLGSKAIGEAVAAAVLAAGLWPSELFPSLIQLPTTATAGSYFNANPMMTGTGGTLGTGPTGQVATGWSLTPPADMSTLAITASKGVSPSGHDEQVLSISGTIAADNNSFLTLQTANIPGVSALTPGTVVKICGRVRVDAGHKGLRSAPIGGFLQGVNIDAAASGFAKRNGIREILVVQRARGDRTFVGPMRRGARDRPSYRA